jgi:hypothetical protein
LPSGDLDGFRVGQASRDGVGRIESLGPEVQAAEEKWGERTTAGLVDKLNGVPGGDWAGYRREAAARALVAALFTAHAVRLSAAEADWAERTARPVVEAERARVSADPAAARARYTDCLLALLAAPAVPTEPRFPAARRVLCAAALDAARWEVRPLLAADRYADAAAVAGKAAAALFIEARTTGLGRLDTRQGTCDVRVTSASP